MLSDLRLYTVGCSNSYFDFDIPKLKNVLLEKINLDKSIV